MAYTQADIDALKTAIASGAIEVRHSDGRMVRYRSLQEMENLLNIMQADLGATGTVINRQYRVYSEKGWGS